MKPTTRSFIAVFVLAPFAAATGQGKGRLELTPYLGMYLPTADIIKEVDQTTSLTLTFKQQSALSLGARFGFGLSERASLEGALGYTPSDVEVAVTGAGSASRGGTVVTASARIVYRLSNAASGTSWHVIGGLGVISRGGSIWNDLKDAGLTVSGRTDLGAVLGAGATIPIGSGVGLRIDLEDYLHQAKFTMDTGAGSVDTKSIFQNDLVLSAGLAFALGK